MKIGFAFCGSYCTHRASLDAMRTLLHRGHDIFPIVSENAASTDTRFGSALEFLQTLQRESGHTPICSIREAEPLGPTSPLDILIISPCTGNTLAKLAAGITDTAVCMAAKAHRRTGRPLLIALASNDALSSNLANIGRLLQGKNIFFVPLLQDDPLHKPHSLVADFSRIPQSLDALLQGEQIRPLFLTK